MITRPPEMSGSIRQEDAFLVGLTLCDRPNREYWEDGRRVVCDLRAGETCLHDLKRNPKALLDKPYHSLAFYLPRAALDAVAEEANAPRIRDLSYKPGVVVNDVTISSLGRLVHCWGKSRRMASGYQGIANRSSRGLRKLYPAARQNGIASALGP